LIRHITGFRDTLRRIVLVGAPLLISQMSQYLMSLADTAMIGRLGAESLTSIAIGAKTSWLLFVFVWPVSVGVQAIVARRHGRNETGNHDNVALSPVLGAGLIYAAIASGLSLGLSFLAKPVYGAVLSSPAVTDGAMEYLLYVRWAVPFLGAGMIVQGFMNAMRRTRIVMVITVVTNSLNVLLNWIFIFGKFGVPAMGIAGAGLATLLSLAIQATALWVMFAYRPAVRIYRGQSFRPEPGTLRRLSAVSLPIAVQNGLALFIFLAFDTLVENLGAAYLAVTQIIFSFYRINKTIVGGFARGAGILAGNALGAGETEDARRAVRVQQALGVFIGLCVMSLVLAVPESLVRIFTNETELVNLGARALRFFAAFFLMEISAFSLEIIFQSVGWSRYVLFSEFSTNVVFILGASLLLVRVFEMGIWGAWIGFGLYQVGHAVILILGWLSGRWISVKVED
jgi:MATE family multidrug resistance protein